MPGVEMVVGTMSQDESHRPMTALDGHGSGIYPISTCTASAAVTCKTRFPFRRVIRGGLGYRPSRGCMSDGGLCATRTDGAGRSVAERTNPAP